MNLGNSVPRRELVKHWRSVLDTIGTVSVIAACGVMIWTMWPGKRVPTSTVTPPVSPASMAAAALPTEPLSLAGAETRGNRAALVAIIEFSDFQCPACGRFARDTLPQLEKRYVDTGQVLLAFRHYPLAKIHKGAVRAAEAAECAGRQGKFWQMHDLLFQTQQQFDESGLIERGQKLSLDLSAFTGCLKGQAIHQINEDQKAADILRVKGTPTFLIGMLQPDGRVRVVRRTTGSQGIDELGSLLDELLSGK